MNFKKITCIIAYWWKIRFKFFTFHPIIHNLCSSQLLQSKLILLMQLGSKQNVHSKRNTWDTSTLDSGVPGERCRLLLRKVGRCHLPWVVWRAIQQERNAPIIIRLKSKQNKLGRKQREREREKWGICTLWTLMASSVIAVERALFLLLRLPNPLTFFFYLLKKNILF